MSAYPHSSLIQAALSFIRNGTF